MYLYLKRIFDLIVAIMVLPFFLMLALIIAILIKLEDGGPVYYCGGRLGKDGKVFKMFKFRSMIVNAPDLRKEDGSTYNSDDDPRLTRVGRFLRKTSLDETPQIINVILGHMSFIGPRPDLPEHFEVYSDHQKKKLKVLPGISGYNQAYFRNSIDWFERIENDIFYIEHFSLWMDIKILFKTVQVVLKKEGIFVNGKQKDSTKPADI